ncbi:MAG: flagellar basal body-associated FliL family protein [Planctomycetes bacterium]|nr:flagellar basal body-associated FliL family protein [Planctomycetota bacterium]
MSFNKILILIAAGLAAAAAGFFGPEIIGYLQRPAGTDQEGDDQPPAAEIEGEITGPFVDFGSVVVNLNEESYSSFHIDLRLQFDVGENPTDAQFKEQMTDYEDRVKRNRPVLRSWLITYLADKTVADIRGKANVNKIRTDILNAFNGILFPGGQYRLQDVLFDEYFWEGGS